MNPITPARFIELLEISELEIDGQRHIILYDKHGNEYKKSLLGMFDREWRCYDSNSTAYSILSRLYESQPQTPLDKLNKIVSEFGKKRVHMDHFENYEDIKAWRDEYESQLKELKS